MLDGITVSATDISHIFTIPGTYTITLIAVDTSSCGFSDTSSVQIFLPPPAQATAWGSDTVCLGNPIPLFASGGATYSWSPPGDFQNPNVQNPSALPSHNTTYVVTVTDTNGCSDTAHVSAYVYPVQYIDAGNDLVYDIGQGPLLHPSIPTGGTYYWTPPAGLSCTNCLNPEATPEVSTTYYLYYTDASGCPYVDSVTVLVTPSVYIPNAFTPNGDGINDFFMPIIRNLQTFTIDVFDRWGEIIFSSSDMNTMWDGTHKGIKVKTDVYVWKIRFTSDIDPYSIHERTGHVTLLR
jgi:gliding motility-associated-like protein